MTASIGETAPPFDVADRIAAAVGGPVIVEDASFRVLGYSAFVGPMDRGRVEAILGRRIPEAWFEHLTSTGSVERLRRSRDVVDLQDGPWEAHRRLITAFRADDRLLGFAWVAEGDEPLGDGAAAALRRAVDETTPVMLRHLERLDAEEEHRSRLAAALLDGLPGAPAAADRLGLERDGRFVVLAVAVPGGATGDAPAPAERVVEHLRRCLESFRRRGAATPRGDGALAVLALGPDEVEETAARLGQEVLRLAGAGPLRTMRVAASSVGTGLAALPRLRDEAGAAAVVAPGDGCFVSYRDVEAEALVADVVAALPPDLRLSGLDRLREADRGNGELERTLRAFLATCGSASATAQELGVHVTTVRHRLDRIAAVSGLRLDRPEVRIACDLVLRRPSP
ncbi:helix-turn-helix domain-containing protein [Nocardioides caldifontis]|uniref:helix-turn-helix domain-containing protein n=1 Tax=Nocardioides caldifontis TaxID=2588938 RepID=UPI0011DF421B|nr:helix-turn-helix domain-containing protein [Nocardioides caldifontis]